MRITNNTVSDNIVRQIQQLGNNQAKLQNQVSTGQRIFNPEDDPTAMGRVLNLETEQRQIAQYLDNGNRALEISQASFSGLQALKKVSDRATEIGTLGSGALNPSQTQAYASEVDQLIEQALQLGNTKFRNDYVFGGTELSAKPFVETRVPPVTGKVTSVTYAGNTQQMNVQLSENASIAPGTSGATNTGIGALLNQLVTLRDALTANNATAITSAQGALVGAEDMLVSALAEHGAIQTRIEANQNQQQDRATNLEKLVSGETDADLPTMIVKLNQNQTAYQAALQSAASIMRISLLDYIK